MDLPDVIGATLSSQSAPGETPTPTGSALIVVAEDETQARELLKNDIFARSGVWDVEKAQVIPVCFLSDILIFYQKNESHQLGVSGCADIVYYSLGAHLGSVIGHYPLES